VTWLWYNSQFLQDQQHIHKAYLHTWPLFWFK